jgi:hypothetical protein
MRARDILATSLAADPSVDLVALGVAERGGHDAHLVVVHKVGDEDLTILAEDVLDGAPRGAAAEVACLGRGRLLEHADDALKSTPSRSTSQD